MVLYALEVVVPHVIVVVAFRARVRAFVPKRKTTLGDRSVFRMGIENYHVVELVGEGSFGKVYKGRRKFTGQVGCTMGWSALSRRIVISSYLNIRLG